LDIDIQFTIRYIPNSELIHSIAPRAPEPDSGLRWTAGCAARAG
jgi:hypothetical protein